MKTHGARRSVAFVLPSLAGGGAENVMLTFLTALDRDHFDPSLILLSSNGPLAGRIPDDVTVTDLQRPRVRHARKPLAKHLKAQAPDLVFSTMAHLNFGLLSVRQRLHQRTRLVVREANTPAQLANGGVQGWAYRHGYRRLYRHAHRIIAPARFIRGQLSRDFKVPDQKLRVLYNPVDEATLRQQAMRGFAPPPDRKLHFVAAGRLTAQKGFLRLLDWFAAARTDSHLTIYGDGPDRSELIAKVRTLGLEERVSLPGFAQPIAPHLAMADAFLLPSFWEGMPNTALESLAVGTPVIGTPEAGGLPEVRQLTGPGPITLARAAGFTAALNNIVRRQPATAPGPSLLPEAFQLSKAIAGLQAILSS